MPCRICLEDEGPFIHPCYCSGTMKDVHQECLFEWIRTIHLQKCELCHAPLYIHFNYEMEAIGYLDGFNLQILTNPALHIMVHCLVMLFFCSSSNFTLMMTERFLQFQITYNGIYIAMMYYFIQKRVRNRGQYVLQLLSFPRVLVLLVNIFLLLKLIESHNPLNMTRFIMLSLVNQSYIGLYPLLHNHILDQINKGRHPTIIARHNLEHNH